MADSESSQGQERRRVPSTRSKNIVCISCRQSKVRCIGSDQQSCERCTRLSLDCHRDPGYKRVSKSRKIAELEKQVQLLASTVNNQSGPPSNTSRSQQPPPSLPSAFQHTGSSYDAIQALEFRSQANIWQPYKQTQPQIDPSLSNATGPSPSIQGSLNGSAPTHLPGSGVFRPAATMSRTIESLQLSPTQIDALFQIFFENYHPFLPFLDPSKCPDEYHKSGPTLFWVIIGVASRRYREDFTLLTVLSEWVLKLIWIEISKPPYKITTVQAMIVLSIWPFPTTSTWTDTSATMSANAISAAMQVGLHRPFNIRDFSRTITNANEVDLSMSTRTWAAANIVSQFSSAVSGQLPNAPFDRTIDRACEVGNIYTLPDDLRLKLLIQRYCHRVNKAMCSFSYDCTNSQLLPTGEPLSFMISWQNDMAMFESELDTLEQESTSRPSGIDRLYFLAARSYLHSFYLINSSPTSSGKAGIMNAYNSAINLVSSFGLADKTSQTLLYLPYYHFRSLLTAACVIIKVLKSSYAQDLDDFEAGRKAFNESILVLSKSSVSNNDTGGKAVKLLSQMWHSGTGSENSTSELTIKSRYGASITYDFIWKWRKDFGGPSRSNIAPSNEIPPQENSPAAFPGVFQDAAMSGLDFLDDPGWNLGFGEVPMFGTLGIQ